MPVHIRAQLATTHTGRVVRFPRGASDLTLGAVPIGIVTRNRPAYLVTTLTSVLASDLPQSVPIFIFDDGSTDPVQRKFLTTNDHIILDNPIRWPNSHPEWQKLVGNVADVTRLDGITGKLDVRMGKTSLGPMGVKGWAVTTLFHKYSEAPAVVVLEDDIIVNRDWYWRLLNAFQNHPQFGLVSGMHLLSEPDDGLPRIVSAGWTTAQMYCYTRFFYETSKPLFAAPPTVDRGSDHIICRAVRRSGLRVGLLRPAACQHIGIDSVVWPLDGFWASRRFDPTYIPGR